ncbi:DHHC palmitoyltransferase-domain-containing protein [Mycena epipterygia]|nr:DHHC palmitoyltransferase-domain-containing protein [Mycena epipterygia]
MPTGNAAPPDDKLALDKPTLCGTISEVRYTARERREARARKPQPWVVRKLMVVFTLGIMGYTAGRRGEGVGLLVGWSVLYAWMVWAYLKVIFTPPGNACDYVPKTPQPLFPCTQWEAQDHEDPRAANNYPALADIEAGRIGGPAYEELNVDNSPVAPPGAHVPGTTIPLPLSQTNGDAATPRPSPRRESSHCSDKEARIPRGRFPPTTAPLLPPHRWCAWCAIVKPYRAHHCHVCGTCVLKFDHHCPCASTIFPPRIPSLASDPLLFLAPLPLPFPSSAHDQTTNLPTTPGIGQCVGARNHKFFLNFSFATLVFTSYTFASLVAFNVTDGRRSVDPQEVVVIVLCVLSFIHPSIPSPSLPAPPFIPITTQGGGGEVLGGRIRGVYIV